MLIKYEAKILIDKFSAREEVRPLPTNILVLHQLLKRLYNNGITQVYLTELEYLEIEQYIYED